MLFHCYITPHYHRNMTESIKLLLFLYLLCIYYVYMRPTKSRPLNKCPLCCVVMTIFLYVIIVLPHGIFQTKCNL